MHARSAARPRDVRQQPDEAPEQAPVEVGHQRARPDQVVGLERHAIELGIGEQRLDAVLVGAEGHPLGVHVAGGDALRFQALAQQPRHAAVPARKVEARLDVLQPLAPQGERPLDRVNGPPGLARVALAVVVVAEQHVVVVVDAARQPRGPQPGPLLAARAPRVGGRHGAVAVPVLLVVVRLRAQPLQLAEARRERGRAPRRPGWEACSRRPRPRRCSSPRRGVEHGGERRPAEAPRCRAATPKATGSSWRVSCRSSRQTRRVMQRAAAAPRRGPRGGRRG